jgi:thioredoxin-related protein
MKRKNLLISLSILLLAIPLYLAAGNNDIEKSSNKETINWISIDEAQRLSKEAPRKVIVDVYTDWCLYCKRMDKNTFSNAEVVKYVNENFYAVKLNAESPDKVNYNGTELTKRELAQAFRVRAYPTIVLIDEEFSTIFPIPGYREAAEFKNILEQIKDQKPKKD